MSDQAQRPIALPGRLITTLTVVCLVILFIAVNLFSTTVFRSARVDLTEKGLFTLSEGTLNTLAKLEEPVTLTFYLSERHLDQTPGLRPYAQRVRDLLSEYAAASGGMLRLEIIDPEPFSEAEDRAQALGLRPAQTPDGELFFFGLAGTNTVDGREAIPYFTQERAKFLEYDVTELVHNLSTLEKPVLGIVTSLPMDTGPGGMAAAMQGRAEPYLIYTELQARFQTRFLEQDFKRVPEDVDVLMVAHPKPLNERTLYAIDQFVLDGGRALVFVDPSSELAMTPGPTGEPLRGSVKSSDLDRLLSAWGVAYDANEIVADREQALLVETRQGGRRQQVSYVAWLGIDEDRLNSDDLVTGDMNVINLAMPGRFLPIEGTATQMTPLVMSTGDAQILPREAFEPAPDPAQLLRDFAPTGEIYTIAARVSGPVISAFADGPPQTDEPGDPTPVSEGEAPKVVEDVLGEEAVEAETPEEAEHLTASKGPINVILMADSDIFDDRFWVREDVAFGQRVGVPIADNAVFVVSAVENLTGSNDLISLRARTSGERPFTVVEDLRRRAEDQYLEKQQRLQEELAEAEKRLAQLQGQEGGLGADAGALLSPEEEAEIARFERRVLEIRAELREVKRSLRAEIDALGDRLAFINIALMPLLMALFALGLAWWRATKRKERVAAGGGA